jgi:bacterial/archaeal transporter family protein
MKPWLSYALLSMVFAGCTAVVAKLGLTGISAELGLTVRSCFVCALVLAFALVVIPTQQWATLTRENYLWLGLSGACTAISWIFYYKAIKEGEVSTVALIDKASIVVAVLLSWLLLKEQLTTRTITGCCCMLAGLFIMVKR